MTEPDHYAAHAPQGLGQVVVAVDAGDAVADYHRRMGCVIDTGGQVDFPDHAVPGHAQFPFQGIGLGCITVIRFLVHITGIDFHGKASSLFRCLDYTIYGTSAGCPTGKIGRK